MKDYKPGEARVQRRSRPKFLLLIPAFGLLCLSIWLGLSWNNDQSIETAVENQLPTQPTMSYAGLPATQTEPNEETAPVEIGADVFEQEIILDDEIPLLPEPVYSELEAEEVVIAETEIKQNEDESAWQKVTVKSGDSLALIFSRLGLSPRSLYNIMSLGKDVTRLKRLQPGQTLNFNIQENELLALEYEMSLTQTLKLEKQDTQYVAKLVTIELESVVKNTSAVINDSLFLSGKRAGLSDNLIMQLVSIYGWDIDFALDIREGDSFTLIYEEQYKDGIKVTDGPIIAAEFVNRNEPLRAIRYTHTDGRVDYYAENGDAMRKAFLRTPVEFARISSRFNLRRKHPILNRIRAHKGVDYAAPTGTPIKATGDGTVALAGRKGGYGKTVILKHGGKYSTVYAHLHRYAKGRRTGTRKKQVQIIGNVGKTSLATGHYLHYEFRVNGVHRNPLTVKLPKAESISKDKLPEFRQFITPMLAELDQLTGKSVLAAQQSDVLVKQSDSVMEDG